MRRLQGIHPFLFAMYPVMALLASNLGQLYPVEAARSLVVALIGAALLLALGRAVFGDWDRSALVVSMALLVFFTYGHFYDLLEGVAVGGILIGRHRYLVPMALGLIVVWTWWAARRLREPEKAGVFSCVVGVGALALPAYAIAAYYLLAPRVVAAGLGEQVLRLHEQVATSEERPDIYYIILDGYGREDVLRDLYDFDNSEFIEALEQRGFFVAGESRSNYMMTGLSLASSLNMEYVDQVATEMGAASADGRWLAERIAHSTVRTFLESQGYEMVAFDSGWPVSDIRDADIFLSPGEERAFSGLPLWKLNEFEILLLRLSLIRPAIDRLQVKLQGEDSLLEWPYLRHRDRILFALETMKQIPTWDGDYFVFAHLVTPHPPFVFGPNGEPIPHTRPYSRRDGSAYEGSLQEYEQRYRDQITYINRAVLRLIDRLLIGSDPDPVIILQADHGPRARVDWGDVDASNMREVFSILNAYHLPWQAGPQPYEAISPVNSFRLILNGLFEEQLDMIPDESFLTVNVNPLELVNVTERAISD